MVARGLSPDDVTSRTFKALEENRTYVITRPEYKDDIIVRHRQIENAITGAPETDVDLLALVKSMITLEPLT